MALPIKVQLRYWGIAAVVFAVVLWLLGDVLMPFILGSAIAYFIDPVADRLERAGLSRTAATALITIIALVVTVLLGVLVFPTLISQAIELIEVAPNLFRDLQDFVTRHFPSIMVEGSAAREALTSIGEAIKTRGPELINSVLGSARSVLGIVVLLVVVPVVSVYMLLDWDRMIARIDKLLPRDLAPVIRELASEIDTTLASFIRGMGTVSVILGSYYAIALMAVGLQFGLVVGFVAGLVTFIPYLGAVIGGSLAIGLAMFQYWGDWAQIGLVGLIFVIGQVIEGNVLTPKLVGGSIGLHPVWLLLALSVFGALFGFVGMLVAVPVAAALGVLARFAVGQYLSSALYRGTSGEDET